MGKFKTFLLIIFIVILSLAAEILFGGWISARLATWPAIRRFNLYNPRAPIVITNTEVVRTSDTEDAIDAVNKGKSRLSAVAMLQNNRLTVTGSAINATADGYFVTSQAVFAVKGAAYFVVLNSGQSVPITALYVDPGTNLMFFKANVNSVTVAPFAGSRNLVPGQKVVVLENGLSSFTARFAETWVSRAQSDNLQVLSSDRPARSFGIQNVGALTPGQAVLTLDGEVAGLWDGSALVSSDALKADIDSFFSNGNAIRRPVFGFSYRAVTKAESSTLNVPQGAVIAKADVATPAVVANSPAAAAGLQEGDYIVQINDTKIIEGVLVEEVLARIKPGDLVALTVVRNKQTLILNLTAGEIK